MPLNERVRRVLSPIPGAIPLARMTSTTFSICMRYRVTGLAAEAGYFALLSLPPLVFGLLGFVGYIGGWFGQDTVQQVMENINSFAARYLTEQIRTEVVTPTLNDALHGGRPDVISIGFLLSLWSGSRALNVLLDTVSIMYGQGGKRGIVRTRAMSLSLYFLSLAFGAIVLPLIVIGPQLLSDWLPASLQFLMVFYWPLVGSMTILGFATLFYLATPNRTPWVRDLPGAVLTLVIWVLASMVLRWFLGNSTGGASIYGPLAATICVLIWLYFLGIAVLIGAALNAAIARLWPAANHTSRTARATERARDLLRDGSVRIVRAKRGGLAEENEIAATDDDETDDETDDGAGGHDADGPDDRHTDDERHSDTGQSGDAHREEQEDEPRDPRVELDSPRVIG